ncbi:AAA family ATPase [Desulfosporosinus nitroreducens]|uniref:AAA family ATPase n=1 Tax=Desulfosporosinus nitroreducens TaxID=2018668 RepID=UPI00207C30C8|nr:AAA family ATPase [Desulfosporosinus nitroreducens]MCO1599743.1 AAA family ATPase [Desulfosporosinus nitroreducens]
MIKKISVIQYRKIKNLEFEFSKGINVISGTNGTCKTSILHIVSNSFQAVNKKCPWLIDDSCLEIIKKVNSIINPKVESLTRGDKRYNDPAFEQKGSLFTIDYFDKTSLGFRRHNSKMHNRYSIKPFYPKGTKDSLPYCPVIYLGLSRLLPFGEFQNDDAIEGVKKTLPLIYQQEIADVYRKFTGLSVSSTAPQKMGDIKIRADFSSDQNGIDSNTISAGEDNLFILITAIVSLKYYFNCITSSNTVESILLIDEMDATLHPSLQIKLLELYNEYSKAFKIQIIFTSHSLSLLEHALSKKYNVIYLIDNISTVLKMEAPDIYKIKMHLHNITRDDIYTNKVIPVFTEDKEARLFLNILFDYYTEKYLSAFSKVKQFFHLIDANISANNLLNIFDDIYLLKSTMQSICILDGDQKSKQDYNKYVITLPGANSPEKLIMDYSIQLFDNDDQFWTEGIIINLGYGKIYYRENIRPDIDSISEKLKELNDKKESTHGVQREISKKVFNRHKRFFEILFRHWVNNTENEDQLNKFYKDLYVMFKKVAVFHGINSKEWDLP